MKTFIEVLKQNWQKGELSVAEKREMFGDLDASWKISFVKSYNHKVSE